MEPLLSAWEKLPGTRALIAKNPLHANALVTRDDLQRAVQDLVAPLLRHVSPGGAALHLGAHGVVYDSTAAGMEALLRPLWGIVPLVAGGGQQDCALWLSALDHGTDPAHPEYWGDVGPFDQRMVEMAALALALLLAPKQFWEPLSDAAKDRAAAWLLSGNSHPTIDNNWLFFRALTNLALRHVGRDWSRKLVRTALDRLDEFHIADGYYRDGTRLQIDYYTPMGMHFYGLIVAQVASDLFPAHARRYRQRARAFAQDFQHWFADDGAAVPFGRSMAYRSAQVAFWAALAFAGEEALPWGRIKGLLFRNLRWWATQPIAERDGVLSVGYSYPNLMMSETYNAPGSPYWALKPFLVLAVPPDHPFWTTPEEAPDAAPSARALARPGGFVLRRSPGDAVMLTGGQDGHGHRGCDAKYGRFAYSSAFAFSVPADSQAPDRPPLSACDSGLMVSRDGLSWAVRGQITTAGIDADMAWGRWQPDDSLTVDTWLDFAGEGWHMRLHRFTSETPLYTAEGGFSLDRTAPFVGGTMDEPGFFRTASGVSGLIDLTGGRSFSVVTAAPNVNLRFPRTRFPRLAGLLLPGTSWVGTAVYAKPDPAAEVIPFELPATMLALLAREGLEPDL